MTILAQDSFAGRSNSGTWNTASDGETWNHKNGAFQNLAVAGGEGTCHQGAPGQMLLGSGTATDQEGLVRLATGQDGDLCGLILRDDGTGTNCYMAAIGEFANDITVYKIASGSRSYLDIQAAGFTISNGSFYWLRFQVSGTTLKCRLWASGATEPLTWQSTVTDSAYASGQYGIYLYSQDVIDCQFDSYQANDTQSATLRTQDIPSRLVLAVARLRDIGGRLRVQAQALRDTSSRVALVAQSVRSLSSRVRLSATSLKSLSSRLSLKATGTHDVAGRFLLQSLSIHTLPARLILLSTQVRDLSVRLVLRTPLQARDVSLRLHLSAPTPLVSTPPFGYPQGIVLFPLRAPSGFAGVGEGPGVGQPADTIGGPQR